MTTYLDKNARVFLEHKDVIDLLPRRAEGSLKSYNSTTDLRNWCNNVEDRRQHILELVTKNVAKCFGGLLPVEEILKLLLSSANNDLSKLKHCLNQLWKFIDGLTLNQQNLTQLEEISGKMDRICLEIRGGDFTSNSKSLEVLFKSKNFDSGQQDSKMKNMPRGLEVESDYDAAGTSHIKTRAQTTPTQQNQDTKQDKIPAEECVKHLSTIQELTNERNSLRNKQQDCLKELENFKKRHGIDSSTLPSSCQQEIQALETTLKQLRSGNRSPEEEAQFIEKEVDTLKRYCNRLKEIETENVNLKAELNKHSNQEDLDKIKQLSNEVEHLKNQLSQYQDNSENVVEIRRKSEILDSVLEERDKMNEKIKNIKELEQELKRYKIKAGRVDELESRLKKLSTSADDQRASQEENKLQLRSLEADLKNSNAEKAAMLQQIKCMKKALEHKRGKETEIEILRLERDRLQIKLNQICDIQGDCDVLLNKINAFDNVAAEREMYKRKYKEALDRECQCELIKAQINEARSILRERDNLEKQIEDLKSCICAQECEIDELTAKVEELSLFEANDNEIERVLELLHSEMNAKDLIISASQEQLIETEKMAECIRDLEKLFDNAEQAILQKNCHIQCLEKELPEGQQCVGKCRDFLDQDMESMELMRRELSTANAENQRLQEIANRILQISGGGKENVKKLLKESANRIGQDNSRKRKMKMSNEEKIANEEKLCFCTFIKSN